MTVNRRWRVFCRAFVSSRGAYERGQPKRPLAVPLRSIETGCCITPGCPCQIGEARSPERVPLAEACRRLWSDMTTPIPAPTPTIFCQAAARASAGVPACSGGPARSLPRHLCGMTSSPPRTGAGDGAHGYIFASVLSPRYAGTDAFRKGSRQRNHAARQVIDDPEFTNVIDGASSRCGMCSSQPKGQRGLRVLGEVHDHDRSRRALGRRRPSELVQPGPQFDALAVMTRWKDNRRCARHRVQRRASR